MKPDDRIVIDDAAGMVEDFLSEQYEGDTPEDVRLKIAAELAPDLIAAFNEAQWFIEHVMGKEKRIDWGKSFDMDWGRVNTALVKINQINNLLKSN